MAGPWGVLTPSVVPTCILSVPRNTPYSSVLCLQDPSTSEKERRDKRLVRSQPGGRDWPEWEAALSRPPGVGGGRGTEVKTLGQVGGNGQLQCPGVVTEISIKQRGV